MKCNEFISYRYVVYIVIGLKNFELSFDKIIIELIEKVNQLN